METLKLLGVIGNYYFQAKGNSKAQLGLRTVVRAAKSIADDASVSHKIEVAGQTIDTLGVIAEAFEPVGDHFPALNGLVKLGLNASHRYFGEDDRAAHKFFRNLESGIVGDDEAMEDMVGIIMSIDPQADAVSSAEVDHIVNQGINGLPWMARRCIGIADKFVAGALGAVDEDGNYVYKEDPRPEEAITAIEETTLMHNMESSISSYI